MYKLGCVVHANLRCTQIIAAHFSHKTSCARTKLVGVIVERLRALYAPRFDFMPSSPEREACFHRRVSAGVSHTCVFPVCSRHTRIYVSSEHMTTETCGIHYRSFSSRLRLMQLAEPMQRIVCTDVYVCACVCMCIVEKCGACLIPFEF